MPAFSRYLVDLNVVEMQRKAEHQVSLVTATSSDQIKEVIWDYYTPWEGIDLPESIFPNLPIDAANRISGQEAEVRYEQLLLDWLSTLKWPNRPQQDEFPLQVTYMELFAGFTFTTWQRPPREVFAPNGSKWIPWDSPDGLQQPSTSKQLVGQFVQRIRRLERQLGRDLLLAAEVYGVAHLSVLGAASGLTVLDGRPQLEDLHLWIPELLVWLRQDGDSTYVHDRLCKRLTAHT